MSGYDKMHQSLLDGQKVCLFIEAFSLHLYRAFYINGWLPDKLHSLKPYDDIKMKVKTVFFNWYADKYFLHYLYAF